MGSYPQEFMVVLSGFISWLDKRYFMAFKLQLEQQNGVLFSGIYGSFLVV